MNDVRAGFISFVTVTSQMSRQLNKQHHCNDGYPQYVAVTTRQLKDFETPDVSASGEHDS